MTFDLSNDYNRMKGEFGTCGEKANSYTPGHLATGCDRGETA